MRDGHYEWPTALSGEGFVRFRLVFYPFIQNLSDLLGQLPRAEGFLDETLAAPFHDPGRLTVEAVSTKE
jgi:hypothetical protein